MKFLLRIHILNINPSYLVTILFLVSIPFTVSFLPILIIYALALSVLLLHTPNFIYNTRVNKKLFYFLLFLIMPSMLGIISLFPSSIINSHGLDYSQLNIFGRIFNILFFPCIIIIIDRMVSKHGLYNLVFWVWFGGLIFVGFGIWHAASIYGFIGSFPFETRSHVHSAGTISINVDERLTGVAREPSFFGPFVVDFTILTLLIVYSRVKRLGLLVISVLLIVLSLSPSGFMVLVGTFLGGFLVLSLRHFLSTKKISLQYIIYIGIVTVLLVALLKIISNLYIFDYIFYRFSFINESGRFFMSVMPFKWSWESNVYSFLFGHGIKTYSIIGTQFMIPSGGPVHPTSNNIFADIFWESGLVGLSILIIFYFYCFFKILTSKVSSFQIFIAGAILFDMFFSGFVRSDFASMRVFIMFYFFFHLINYDMRGPRSILCNW